MSKVVSVVKGIGLHSDEFRSTGMLILFGESAQFGLEDYCVQIELPTITASIVPGDHIFLGNMEFTVTAIGEKVMETLSQLGHCTIRFDGETQAVLPGTMHLDKSEYPELKIGDQIIV